MQYRNISENRIEVRRAIGPISVDPGDLVLTSPKFGKPLVEQGLLEPVPVKAATKSTRKSEPKEGAE